MTPARLLALGPTPWEGVWARPQQLLSRLAALGTQVLYVDPSVTWLGALRRPPGAAPGANPRAVSAGIWVHRPRLAQPLGNVFRRVNRLNMGRLAGELTGSLAVLGWKDFYLWSWLPGAVDLVETLAPGRVIYDCADDHAAFRGLLDPGLVRRLERELAVRADFVFASAGTLAERLGRESGRRVLLVPNGGDVDHFAAPRPLPAALVDVLPPRLGFVGALGEWIDTGLLARVVREHPGVSLVLAGPVLADPGELAGMRGVHFLGPVPYAELPGYVQGFALCLAPFRNTPLTRGVNPIKVYEYLAAGREVVATALPELAPLAGVVHVSPDADAFCQAVGELLAGRGVHDPAALAAAARANSWEERLGRITAALAQDGSGH
ncbi:MAG: glycosyltransferase [Thermaerobacter sp.]|nr:glycosyltransferase [Thermaerobacter sp.]